MAIDYIKITRDSNTESRARLIIDFVEAQRVALERGERLLAILNHNHDGSDFSQIETLFGVPAGSGQTLFDLVNGAVGSMKGVFQVADAKTITEKVG